MNNVRNDLIEEIVKDLENITLEELQSIPSSKTVALAYQKGYNEAMKFCTNKLTKSLLDIPTEK